MSDDVLCLACAAVTITFGILYSHDEIKAKLSSPVQFLWNTL